MTAREQGELPLPELFVVVASAEDATAFAPLAVRDAEVRPVLVATGPDPMAVDEVLDDLGALAGRVLLVEAPAAGPVAEVAALLPRVDALVADDRPAAVLVRGGSPTALAATQVAVWRDVPVVAVPVEGGTAVEDANQAAIAALVATQDAHRVAPEEVRAAAATQRLVRERLTGGDGTRIVRLPTDRSRPGLSA
jgi:UDP-N-acetylglucosamine 2-epimerase